LEYNENNLLEYDLALHTKGLKNVPTLWPGNSISRTMLKEMLINVHNDANYNTIYNSKTIYST
jgi:hypothetical protein